MRTWFITGASRGFGELIVQQALEAGDNVIAAACNPDQVRSRFSDHPSDALPLTPIMGNRAIRRSSRRHF